VAAQRISRRRALRLGVGALGSIAIAGVVCVELIDHGVLPGKSLLDSLDGACDVSVPALHVRSGSRSITGSFYSARRRRVVDYRVGYPPGFVRGDALPLIVMLHGDGATQLHAIAGLSPGDAVAMMVDGAPLRPMALVTVNDGSGYRHPHPDDDPMGMVIDELIPMLQRWGLGEEPGSLGIMGVSMGGYGALVMAECHPHLFAAVAAISPAIWTSYDQARAVNAGAFNNSAQFARYDAVTHAAELESIPVRIASGYSDPFHAGVVALADRLGVHAEVIFTGGCHDGPYFSSQLPSSLSFLSSHIR
jgi:pimeloyl-ACP methyl ester carboxylesterase